MLKQEVKSHRYTDKEEARGRRFAAEGKRQKNHQQLRTIQKSYGTDNITLDALDFWE